MLKDSLYTIKKITEENKSVEAIIELNANHEIFKGHFPHQPVLPGACMLQIIKEIIEAHLSKKIQLIKADDIRFSAMVDPTVNKELKILIQYNFIETQQINVSVKILKMDDVVCCRMKATFKSSQKS